MIEATMIVVLLKHRCQVLFKILLNALFNTLFNTLFTPFCIKDAQYATPSPLITAHKVGVLNEKRCKILFNTLLNASLPRFVAKIRCQDYFIY